MGRIAAFRAQGDDLEPLTLNADTLDEATLQTGHGVYSVFRLYPGRRVLRLPHHLERMRASAQLLGFPFLHSDAWLRTAVRQAVEASELEMPRVRLTIPFADPDSALILLEPFSPPSAEVYERGVRVNLAHSRRQMPRAKDSRFIETRRKLAVEHDGGAFEVILCREDGALLEGTSSNFYAVLDGVLRTAGDDVLEGIARSILLEVAPAVLPVVLEPVQVDDLSHLSEAMLTSASRGVIPIVQIEGTVIGDGRPGPFTAQLRARYDQQVERELEPL
jgi:branched-chain amino acid aminotransferase